MHETDGKDYYERLQISPNADADTITRVFRLLAQRYHPDNPDTGDDARFRAIVEAYDVLSSPERRAQYDVVHATQQQSRWRFIDAAPRDATDFALEQQTRRHVLEILYTRRRLEPHRPGLSLLDLGELMGRPVEHLEFTAWYLVQRGFVMRNDQSQLTITAVGVDAVEEQHVHGNRDEPRQLTRHAGDDTSS